MFEINLPIHVVFQDQDPRFVQADLLGFVSSKQRIGSCKPLGLVGSSGREAIGDKFPGAVVRPPGCEDVVFVLCDLLWV